MLYQSVYERSPLGRLVLVAEDETLIGCWFEGQKHFGSGLVNSSTPTKECPAFDAVREWLDAYFAGEDPAIQSLCLAPRGTDFQQQVWAILRQIPAGMVTTYGGIARQIAKDLGRSRMSSQAIGGAVGRNPLAIIVPCHRVVSSTGALTGYAGGIDRKKWLLHHEHVRLPGLDDVSLLADGA